MVPKSHTISALVVLTVFPDKLNAPSVYIALPSVAVLPENTLLDTEASNPVCAPSFSLASSM